eukprot:CAMPEP_0177712876 /NCGR_PEP_ID=MMETSP0484_2-20121128/12635_1 /TAXON_ID=354590 /ORGANISM="Rhodomonas lens, Strain RHODO" /LENGTH=64 /DNA_ID=CAMNT_0019224719 /DNA_START=230 /DNA_END=424 /DNA_ORIENTATION=+
MQGHGFSHGPACSAARDVADGHGHSAPGQSLCSLLKAAAHSAGVFVIIDETAWMGPSISFDISP